MCERLGGSIYALKFGIQKTNEWLIGWALGFSWSVLVIEPAEVGIIALCPWIFDNACVGEIRTQMKNFGLM